MLLLRGATQQRFFDVHLLLFQYMLLLRGATHLVEDLLEFLRFQYMLLLRGATGDSGFDGGADSFNTCSSCEEQLATGVTAATPASFNTCSSCEEQLSLRNSSARNLKFQYMLLLRGATREPLGKSISSPSFNTCSSCEEQPVCPGSSATPAIVSIHAPLARINSADAREAINERVSIHAPLARSNPR